MELVIILVLILINGIFSMSEIAIVSARKSKLQHLAARGNQKASKTLELANNPNQFLSTVQIGVTLIGIVTGFYSGASLSQSLSEFLKQFPIVEQHSESISYITVILLITFVTLIFGELVPKRIGLVSPEKIAISVSGPMSVISKIAYPLVWLLTITTDTVAKFINIKQQDNKVTEEEIKSMLNAATAIGEVEKTEHEIIEKVFFLGDRNVGSLMTHRMDLVFLNIDDSFEEIKNTIAASVHTNFPVYQANIENVIGILNIKKLIPEMFGKKNIDIRNLLSKPIFVPESMNAFKLLEVFKTSSTHFAIVSDQYGSLKGGVSINDLFKAMVGNLYQDSEAKIVKQEPNTWVIDGLISFKEFLKYFEIENQEEIDTGNFYTLGGFILHLSQRIPKEREKFTWKDFSFEILDMDGNRVDKLIINRLK